MTPPRRTVCEECPRLRDAHAVRRRGARGSGGQRCLLDDAVLCCGPATRAGCEALCPRGGAPCIGCLIPANGAVFEREVLRALALRFPDRGLGIVERLGEAGIPNVSAQLRAYRQAGPLLRRALERGRLVR